MKKLSSHAHCAKLIRQELKLAYPNIKFRVTCKTYSGGDSVDIYWSNGMPEIVILKLVSKYKYGHFDGMTDMYNYDNCNSGLPQVKYIFCNREIDESIHKAIFEAWRLNHVGWENLDNMYEYSEEFMKKWCYPTAYDYISKQLIDYDLTNKTIKQIIKEL